MASPYHARTVTQPACDLQMRHAGRILGGIQANEKSGLQIYCETQEQVIRISFAEAVCRASPESIWRFVRRWISLLLHAAHRNPSSWHLAESFRRVPFLSSEDRCPVHPYAMRSFLHRDPVLFSLQRYHRKCPTCLSL